MTTSDAVFCLGDLYSVDIKRLVGHGTPVYGVYGNHCRRGYLRDEGATEVAVDGTAVAGVHYTSFGTVLGVNGCVRYSNAADLQYTQDEFAAALDGLPPVDIVLTHCPPRVSTTTPTMPISELMPCGTMFSSHVHVTCSTGTRTLNFSHRGWAVP